MGDFLLEVRGVTKRFPGVVALSGVNLQVREAEVVALIGENGAGKSTLMKILAGVQAADEGELLIEGQVRKFSGVQEAQAAGVALIHQELNLADNLTVEANIFLGREPGKFGWIDQGTIRQEAERVLDVVGLKVPADTIASYTFYDCIGLANIFIPVGVTSIGDYAFRNCTSLNRVIIPVTVTSIGDSVFSGCANIRDVTIPDSVSSIGRSAFAGCTDLTEIVISNNVTSIGPSAFYECIGLTNIVIPDSVRSIGGDAFWGCSNLNSISLGNGLTSIESYAFFNCTSLSSIVIPDSVTFINYSAFHLCTGLTSIAIPDSVTSIGEDAFSGCSSLSSIVIPDSVTSIGEGAFENCTNLTNIAIPDSTTSIRWQTFRGCIALSRLVIPDSVTFIGGYAFENCTSLTSIVFNGSSSNIFTNSVTFLGIPPETTAHVWPEHASAYGGESAIWNGLTVYLRDTSPKISSLSPDNATTVSISGGPNRNYILTHSPDLQTPFTQIATTPDTITTDSSGRASFTVNTPGDKGFFILEQAP